MSGFPSTLGSQPIIRNEVQPAAASQVVSQGQALFLNSSGLVVVPSADPTLLAVGVFQGASYTTALNDPLPILAGTIGFRNGTVGDVGELSWSGMVIGIWMPSGSLSVAAMCSAKFGGGFNVPFGGVARVYQKAHEAK